MEKIEILSRGISQQHLHPQEINSKPSITQTKEAEIDANVQLSIKFIKFKNSKENATRLAKKL